MYVIILEEIIDGSFDNEPCASMDNKRIKNPYAYAVVKIKMSDGNWYRILLEKHGDHSCWKIGCNNIVILVENSFAYISLSCEGRQILAEKIINYSRFRLPFLFL